MKPLQQNSTSPERCFQRLKLTLFFISEIKTGNHFERQEQDKSSHSLGELVMVGSRPDFSRLFHDMAIIYTHLSRKKNRKKELKGDS